MKHHDLMIDESTFIFIDMSKFIVYDEGINLITNKHNALF